MPVAPGVLAARRVRTATEGGPYRSLLSLFQGQIGDDHLATWCQAADFGGDVGLFAGRRLGQPTLEDLELLFAMPPLPQFLVSFDDSAHAAVLLMKRASVECNSAT